MDYCLRRIRVVVLLFENRKLDVGIETFCIYTLCLNMGIIILSHVIGHRENAIRF